MTIRQIMSQFYFELAQQTPDDLEPVFDEFNRTVAPGMLDARLSPAQEEIFMRVLENHRPQIEREVRYAENKINFMINN